MRELREGKPLVIGRRIALPMHEVVERGADETRVKNRLDFVVFISVDKIREGAREVGAVGIGFTIRGEKGGMKHRMNAGPPADGKIEAEGNLIDNGEDRERTVTSGGEFQGRSEIREVLAFQPHLIANGVEGSRVLQLPFLPRLMGKGLGSGEVGTELG